MCRQGTGAGPGARTSGGVRVAHDVFKLPWLSPRISPEAPAGAPVKEPFEYTLRPDFNLFNAGSRVGRIPSKSPGRVELRGGPWHFRGLLYFNSVLRDLPIVISAV